jgi:hypothetical protein
MAAATGILGAPVVDAVPLRRLRPVVALFCIPGLAVFWVLVFLDELGVIPGPSFLVLVVGSASAFTPLTLAGVPVFAVLTRDGDLWMMKGSWMRLHPLAPIGTVDPGRVNGPQGFMDLTFVIADLRHRVAIPHTTRFQEMVGAARPRTRS